MGTSQKPGSWGCDLSPDDQCQVVRVVVLVTVFWVMMVRGQGGLGGLPGQRVSRTGDTWPPYPGAGLDVWACKAGFYGHSSDCSRFQVYLESFRRTTADFRSSPQMILLW